MKKLILLAGLAALSGCCGRKAQPPSAYDTARRQADARFAAIRATPNTPVPAAAEKRYLSEKTGNDAADGKTPATAWKTTARLNKEALKPGTWVLFERGGLYRGCVMAKPNCTYTAYGAGAKPRIFGSPVDGADPAKWTPTDKANIWAYEIGHDDVGTLVFDGGAAHAIKIVIRTDKKTGEKFNMYTKKPFNSYRDLDGDLHFWHDYYKNGTGKVYLYSVRNPGSRFKSIEFNVKTCGFRVGSSANVTIDNFDIRYVGIHGISAGGFVKGLTVTNCAFAWIGGSIQGEAIFGRDHPTRLGNGVEIYGWCEDYTVADCSFLQVYDAGVTHQYNIPKKAGMKVCDQKRVKYLRNVFDKCNYSVEYFLTAENGNPSRMEDVLVEDNIMLDGGYGFAEQRSDRGCAAHIKAWFCKTRGRAKNYVIRNNVFACSLDRLLDVGAGLRNADDGSSSLPKMEGNTIIGRPGDLFGIVSETSSKAQIYGRDTQAFLDGFGPGNRCFFLEPALDRLPGEAALDKPAVGSIASAADVAAAEKLHPRFAQAFAFLRRKDLATLAPGRYPIDGDNVYAMIQECTLKWTDARQRAEYHRRYLDIQMPLSGEEVFGLPPLPAATDGFDAEKDYALFDADGPFATLKPGEFIILAPGVAHAPCLTRGRPAKIRKVVIKVLYR